MSYLDKTEKLINILEKSPIKEDDLIEFIGKTTREERENIAKNIDENYSNLGGIQNVLEEKLSPKFKELCKTLFQSRVDTAAQKIDSAFGAFSVDEDLIYETIFNSPYWLKKGLIDKFNELTNKNLIEELKNNFTNPVKKNLELFLTTKRNRNDYTKGPSFEDCEKNAKLLSNEDPNNWLNNEEIMRMLANSSAQELLLTARYYNQINDRGILEALNDLNSSPKKFLTDLFYYVICPPQKYAEILNDDLKGLGTSDESMIDIISNRHDVDMTLIKKFYYQLFNSSLYDDIKANTKGNYQKLLLQLVGKN